MTCTEDVGVKIGDDIVATAVLGEGGQVRLGIEAPRALKVKRIVH